MTPFLYTDGTEITVYDYSTRGELLSVDLPDGRTIEHDPLGRRIAKKIDSVVVEKYLWQGLTRLLAVYDGSYKLITRFEYADGRMPVAMTNGGSTYYMFYDQVGSLRSVADTSGNVVKKVEYDSFGNIINDSNPSLAVPFGFAGGLHDRDTGLVRFGYRDYDPDIGRWTAKDPILFAGGDTDLYGYVLNDPVNLVDPEGLEVFLIGKGDYVFRPTILRGPQRYVPPLRQLKETPINPKYIPKPVKPVDWPKTWKGQWLDKIADLLGWGGAGAIAAGGITVGDPCDKSDNSLEKRGFYDQAYNPDGLI